MQRFRKIALTPALSRKRERGKSGASGMTYGRSPENLFAVAPVIVPTFALSLT